MCVIISMPCISFSMDIQLFCISCLCGCGLHFNLFTSSSINGPIEQKKFSVDNVKLVGLCMTFVSSSILLIHFWIQFKKKNYYRYEYSKTFAPPLNNSIYTGIILFIVLFNGGFVIIWPYGGYFLYLKFHLFYQT